MKVADKGDQVWIYQPEQRRLELHEIIAIDNGKLIESRPLELNTDVPVYGADGVLLPNFVHPRQRDERARRLREIVKAVSDE